MSSSERRYYQRRLSYNLHDSQQFSSEADYAHGSETDLPTSSQTSSSAGDTYPDPPYAHAAEHSTARETGYTADRSGGWSHYASESMHGPYARAYVFPSDRNHFNSYNSQRRSPYQHTRAFPYEDRDWRSATPPPPRSPSPSYASLAKKPSSHLSDPSTSRKLLILDLNGTLLLRSSLRPKGKFPPERARDESGRPVPRLRAVHPRPYMPAFQSYLFSPQTESWLDVMVWSSAQPHSVADMVDKCFSENKERLLAVWARDTLGLSEDHYNRKVETVKDLAKPWSQLSSLASERPPSPHSSEASTPRPDRRSPSPVGRGEHNRMRSEDSPQAHSALTTLLLDDSPRKAELQPYNHVCIREYSAERRAKDLENFQKEKEWETAMDVRHQLAQNVRILEEGATADKAAENTVEVSSPQDSCELEQEGNKDPDANATRKRKRKKLRKRAALFEGVNLMKPETHYDETLLAVVGVLDEIKSQSNVAAWIREGGLWGPEGVIAPHGRKTALTDIDAPMPSTGATTADVSDAQVENSEDSDLSVTHDGVAELAHRVKKRKYAVTAEPASDGHAESGNDATATAVLISSPKSTRGDGQATNTPDERAMPAPTLWFEHPAAFESWVSRGRKALEELRIPIEHGIER